MRVIIGSIVCLLCGQGDGGSLAKAIRVILPSLFQIPAFRLNLRRTRQSQTAAVVERLLPPVK